MIVAPQIENTLPQVRWPRLDVEMGHVTVTLTREMDRLARAMNSKDEEEVRCVLLQQSSAAQNALRCDDDLRREKVERLRAAIASGSYLVSVETLAEKMIERITEVGSLHREKRNS
jgi:anti-sigma28 factor (negative regulator of flagellin synthesis)